MAEGCKRKIEHYYWGPLDTPPHVQDELGLLDEDERGDPDEYDPWSDDDDYIAACGEQP